MTAVRRYGFVQCRSIGHIWSRVEATRGSSWGVLMELECAECGMVRRDTIDRLGQVSTRQYVQPEGYRNPEHSDRSEYRNELVRRLTRGQR